MQEGGVYQPMCSERAEKTTKLGPGFQEEDGKFLPLLGRRPYRRHHNPKIWREVQKMGIVLIILGNVQTHSKSKTRLFPDLGGKAGKGKGDANQVENAGTFDGIKALGA